MNRDYIHMVKEKNVLCGKEICFIKHHTNVEELVNCPLCLVKLAKDDEKLKKTLNKKRYTTAELDNLMNCENLNATIF